MEDRARDRWQQPARAAFAALAVALACVLGTALAQQGGQAAADAQPADLFGASPEPPTDHAPAPVHDPANPDARRLQSPQEAFSVLPPDQRGKPDWSQALRSGAIAPRADLPGRGQPLQPLDLDIVMKNTAQMPYVKFPHRAHTDWLACNNCHDGLFVPKAGANPMTMAQILQGQSCGVCHTTVAFNAMYTCERCHSVAQPGQKPWW